MKMKLDTNIRISLVYMTVILVMTTRGSQYTMYHYTPTDIANPTLNYTACRNNKYAFICDPENILRDQSKVHEINATINKIMRTQRCPCDYCSPEGRGYVMGVALVPSIKNTQGMTNPQAVKEAARDLRDNWFLGDCGNDAVMLVAVEQGEIYTSTGQRWRLHVSDRCSEEAMSRARRNFTRKNWGHGILTILDQYRKMMEIGCYDLPNDEYQYVTTTWKYAAAAALTMYILVIIYCIVDRCKLTR